MGSHEVFAGLESMLMLSGLVSLNLRFQPDLTRKLPELGNALLHFAALVGPVWSMLWEVTSGEPSVLFLAQALMLNVVALLILFWSRKSKCQAHYVLRHSLWHVTSAIAICGTLIR